MAEPPAHSARELSRRHHELVADLGWLIRAPLMIGWGIQPENVEAIMAELRPKVAALQIDAARAGDEDLQEALDALATIVGAPLPRHPAVRDRIEARLTKMKGFGAGGRATR